MGIAQAFVPEEELRHYRPTYCTSAGPTSEAVSIAQAVFEENIRAGTIKELNLIQVLGCISCGRSA